MSEAPCEVSLATECRIDTDEVELADACHRLAALLLNK